MFSDTAFSAALIASIILHGVILFQSGYFSFSARKAKPERIEITYVKPRERIIKKPDLGIKNELNRKQRDSLISLPKVNLGSANNTPSSLVQKREEISAYSRQNMPKPESFVKPYLAKPDTVAIKRKVNFHSVDKDKSNNPSYISYYQIVREKIRRAAYQNYTRTEIGEVYLSFVISSDGFLKQTRIVDERSSVSPYLREIALNSVRSSSPFPLFPKELDYPQLSFNVIISFEVE